MNSSWERYPEIKRTFGEEWLNNPKNREHPLFRIHEKDKDQFLINLDKYLEDVSSRKSTSDQLKNNDQFWDVYCELEIAYCLRKLGLSLTLHEKIGGIETDIFLQQEKLVIEVKHLNPHHTVVKATIRFEPKAKFHPSPVGSNILYTDERGHMRSLNMEKMRDYIFEEKRFQEIYPNIVCYCTEIQAGGCLDLADFIEDMGQISKEVSALAIWNRELKEITCCLRNPYGKKLELKSSQLKEFFKL